MKLNWMVIRNGKLWSTHQTRREARIEAHYLRDAARILRRTPDPIRIEREIAK